jgi:hypothetical protein
MPARFWQEDYVSVIALSCQQPIACAAKLPRLAQEWPFEQTLSTLQ